VRSIGVTSFFADFTYEGCRAVIGPYLGTLGAGALAIAVAAQLAAVPFLVAARRRVAAGQPS
jgi:hypothetical protein